MMKCITSTHHFNMAAVNVLVLHKSLAHDHVCKLKYIHTIYTQCAHKFRSERWQLLCGINTLRLSNILHFTRPGSTPVPLLLIRIRMFLFPGISQGLNTFRSLYLHLPCNLMYQEYWLFLALFNAMSVMLIELTQGCGVDYSCWVVFKITNQCQRCSTVHITTKINKYGIQTGVIRKENQSCSIVSEKQECWGVKCQTEC